MGALIKVNTSSDRPTVLARDLHKFLEIGTQFSIWFDRMKSYGFVEHIDYEAINQKRLTAQGNATAYTDYQLTIDTAKEICMIQRTERGKQARQYFLEVEKQWNDPAMVMARALRMAAKQIDELKLKAEMHDLFLSAGNNQPMASVAKSLGIGRNKLFAYLRDNKILRHNNEPYQQYLNRGYFKVVEKPIVKGSKVENVTQTFVTAKGVDFIGRLLTREEAI